MEKMSKEQITKIGNDILDKSDIIANHGTSIKNALSIMETGFYYTRTSMAVRQKKDVVKLCTYGWKENPHGDAANVIISVPKSFIKEMTGYNDKEYSNWLNYIKENNYEEFIIDSVSEKEYGIMGLFKVTVPREFIKGVFFYTDNKNYLNFIDDYEEAMNYLTYMENPHYYENLSLEEQRKFAKEIAKKNNIGEEGKGSR